VKKDRLKARINRYLKKGQLIRRQEFTKLKEPFLTKARKNFTIANLLFRISEQGDVKKALNLPSGFETYDWVIISSYYSMYTSSLAALAKLGFKSKSHAATIAVLESFYVSEKKLEQKHIDKLTKAYTLSEELITRLIRSKERRETAQYDATPAISREMAVSALKDAEEFVMRVEEILS